ncbi:hypothetical protein ABYF32_01360 [Buchananella felis]|uniref:hypothetical protein n=1 Tax=Buchananella felis TaxID=3231492 RepID=UPI0035285D62
MKKSLLTLLNAAYALAAIAAVFLVWAILSATVLKPADRVVATFDPVAANAKSPVLITSPGVLNALPGEVLATVTVPKGEQVAVAIGRTADVDGWSSSYRVAEITGIVDWETLTSVNLDPNTEVATVAPSPAASESASAGASAGASAAASEGASASASVAASAAASEGASGAPQDGSGAEELDTATMQAALTSSDMWTTAKSGTGEVKLKLKPEVDNVSLIAVGTSGAPSLTLSWAARDRSTFLIPGLLWALLFLALAGAVFYVDLLFKREAERRRRNAEKRAAKRAATTQSMRAIDPNSPPPLSRRELARLESGESGEGAPEAAKPRQSILGRLTSSAREQLPFLGKLTGAKSGADATTAGAAGAVGGALAGAASQAGSSVTGTVKAGLVEGEDARATSFSLGGSVRQNAGEAGTTVGADGNAEATGEGRGEGGTNGGFLGAYMPQWPAAVASQDGASQAAAQPQDAESSDLSVDDAAPADAATAGHSETGSEEAERAGSGRLETGYVVHWPIPGAEESAPAEAETEEKPE